MIEHYVEMVKRKTGKKPVNYGIRCGLKNKAQGKCGWLDDFRAAIA